MSDNNHTCTRCGYYTSHLVTFKRHLARKIICKNKISNSDLNIEYIKYNINDKIDKMYNIQNATEMNQNEPKNQGKTTEMNRNEPKNQEKTTEMNQNEPNNQDKKILFECEYCNKEFQHSQSLNRHKKGRCKNINNDNNDMRKLVKLLNEQLKEQQYQIKEQNSQIKELIKKAGITNSNINIQQNIKLLSYGNTDMSHLTDKDYMKCLNHSNFCVPYLIEQIHFDPQKPENHNIYISNIKNNYVMLYNGDKWILKDRDEAITNLIDDNNIILEQKLEEWIENGKEYPKIMNKFKRYIEKRDNNKVLNKIKDEIKLILFNNREIVDKK